MRKSLKGLKSNKRVSNQRRQTSSTKTAVSECLIHSLQPKNAKSDGQIVLCLRLKITLQAIKIFAKEYLYVQMVVQTKIIHQGSLFVCIHARCVCHQWQWIVEVIELGSLS